MSDYTKPYVVVNDFAKSFFVPLTIELEPFVNSMRTLTPAARLQRIEDIAEQILNSRGNAPSGQVRNFNSSHVSGSTVFAHTMNTIFVHADANASVGRHNEMIFVDGKERNIGFGSLHEGVAYITPFSSMLSACIAYHLAKRVNASSQASPRQKLRAREAEANYVSQRDELREIPHALLLYPESWIIKSGDNIYYSDGATPELYLADDIIDKVGFVDIPATLRARYSALRTEAGSTIAKFLQQQLSGAQVLAYLTQQQAQHWSAAAPTILKLENNSMYSFSSTAKKREIATIMLNSFQFFEDKVYQLSQGRELPGNSTKKAFRDLLQTGLRSALGVPDWNFSRVNDITRLRKELRVAAGLEAVDEPLIQQEISRIIGRVTYDWPVHEGSLPRRTVESMVARGASPSRWSTGFQHLSVARVGTERVVHFEPSRGNSVRLTVNGEGPEVSNITAWTNTQKRARLVALLDAVREVIAVLAYCPVFPSESEDYLASNGDKSVKITVGHLRDLVPAIFVSAKHRLGSNV